MAEKGRLRDSEEIADEAVDNVKQKKMLLLAAVVAGLLLVAGGLSWLAISLLDGGATPAAAGAEVEAESGAEAAPPARPPALYLNLDPPFLANFSVNGRQQYLQVAVAVLARDQDALDGINTHMPLIRNRLVMLLSGEQFSQLQTDEGREQLRAKLLQAIREILQQEIGKPGVEQVLFTHFVMQ
jgi:flagellar FliL protein